MCFVLVMGLERLSPGVVCSSYCIHIPPHPKVPEHSPLLFSAWPPQSLQLGAFPQEKPHPRVAAFHPARPHFNSHIHFPCPLKTSISEHSTSMCTVHKPLQPLAKDTSSAKAQAPFAPAASAGFLTQTVQMRHTKANPPAPTPCQAIQL